MGITKIARDTWRIDSMTGARNLFTYLVAGGGEALVLDTGETTTPAAATLPALTELGIARERVRWIVVTHPDADHQGGLAGLRMALPEARTACGWDDRPLVRDPEALLRDRYGAYEHEHGVGFSPADRRWVRAQSGAVCEIDVGLIGGETLLLGQRAIEVVHVPGHSAGHLALFDRELGLLLASDAVHGRFCPAADGSPALPPTYEDVDAYLATIDRVAQLDARELHSCHFPPRRGQEIARFCDDSRRFVEDLDRVMLDGLADRPQTLAQLCEIASDRLGPFGAASGFAMFIVHGHLRRLQRRGQVRVDEPGAVPVRFARVG